MPGEAPEPRGPLPPLVCTTDARLDGLNIGDGAALAAQLNKARKEGGAIWDDFPSTLSQHADDPLFCSGFYNRLTREQLKNLPWIPATSQALATAFASGRLSDRAYADITHVLSPAEVRQLVVAVADGLPKGASVDTAKAIEKDLRTFLVTSTSRLFGPLPKPGPGESPLLSANGWAEGYGTATREGRPSAEHQRQMDEDHQCVGARAEPIVPLMHGVLPERHGHARQRRRDQHVDSEGADPHCSGVCRIHPPDVSPVRYRASCSARRARDRAGRRTSSRRSARPGRARGRRRA